MSHVGGPFKHDIFVSYSHGDAMGDGDSPLKRWSGAFVAQLESELRVDPRFGNALSIFIDQHHRPAQGIDPLAPLTEHLKAEVGLSAVVMALTSPHYLRSAWCRDERDFWASQQEALQLPTRERVALVHIWPVADGEAWPALFLDSRGNPLLGFTFFDRSNQLNPRPFGWHEPKPENDSQFRKAVLDVAGRVGMKLLDIKAMLEERSRALSQVDKLSAGALRTVYLHGRVDQADAWEKAHAILSQGGFAVFPGEPDPIEPDPAQQQKLSEHRISTLSGCDALLLLGSPDKRAVDTDLVVIGRNERESAKARSKTALPCALLDMVGLPVATPQRKRAAQSLQVEWIDSTVDPWLPRVESWLVEKGQTIRRSL